MEHLTPHVDYRTRFLLDEAEARRLAASTTRSGPGSDAPSSARRRLLATTVLALSIAVGSSGAYLAFAAEPTGTGASVVVPEAIDPTPASPVDPDVHGLPPTGRLLHR